MKRVMIVDDDEMGLRCLGRLLRKHFEVTTARNAPEALAQLDVFHPDLVVTDQRMLGFTGVALLDEVRKRMPTCVRVLLSGAMDTAALDARPEAVMYRMTKPWRNDEFVAQLSQMLS